MGKRLKIISLVIIIPLVIFLWPSAVGGKTDFFIVQGQSMLPTILPGSFIITQADPTYEVDDIVAFNFSQEGVSQRVVHRIIEYDPEDQDFIMQGDNNPKPDLLSLMRPKNREIIYSIKNQFIKEYNFKTLKPFCSSSFLSSSFV